METILAIVVGVLLGLALMSLAALALLRAVLRRRLRVSARQRSAAPTAWLVSPSQAARLHRRLRTATQTARLESARPDSSNDQLMPLAMRIEQHAVTVERDLVVASRAARPYRRATLASPAEEVRRIEQHVADLSEVSRQWRANMAGSGGLGTAGSDLGMAGQHPLQDVEDRLAAARWAATHVNTPATTPTTPPLRQPVPDQPLTQPSGLRPMEG